ncbi:uncharacterized protein LOC108675940 [Hyalella azteca]|uniref:Uncharacterized protein LOC108675940 n=1 Tax=Hyalella azteca TaxID=294128 RepID=A0A979FXH7_HYAAZ|nr:uncharacterized protein LOC108675940 [Hyalella azteca]
MLMMFGAALLVCCGAATGTDGTQIDRPVPVNATSFLPANISSALPANATSSPLPTNATFSPLPSSHLPANTTSSHLPANTTSSHLPANNTSSHLPANTTSSTLPANATSSNHEAGSSAATTGTTNTSSKDQLTLDASKLNSFNQDPSLAAPQSNPISDSSFPSTFSAENSSNQENHVDNSDARSSSAHCVETNQAGTMNVTPQFQLLNVSNGSLLLNLLLRSKNVNKELLHLTSGDKKASGSCKSKKVAAYGSWPSPITSDVAVKARNEVIEPPRVDRATGHVFWVEEVSSEDGHGVLFQYNVDNQKIVRWTNTTVDVRSRVYEYGGGSFLVYNNTVFYVSGHDNQLYRQHGPLSTAEKISNSPKKRYADLTYSPKTQRLYCVYEDHGPVEGGRAKEPRHGIAVFDLLAGKERDMFSHADFFAAPRVTEDGTKLVWIQWNHPDMPWDNTRLYAGTLSQEVLVDINVEIYLQHNSMMTPNWNQHHELLYIHDLSGWWNLYIVNRQGAEANLTPTSREVGWPSWMLGWQAFDSNPVIGAHEVVVIVGRELRIVNTKSYESRTLDTGHGAFYLLGATYSNDGKKIYTVAGDGRRSLSVVEVDVNTGASRRLVDDPLPFSDEFISVPAHVQFNTTDRMTAYGYLYLPQNGEYEGPADARPPLLVHTHGGPTACAKPVLNLNVQFFTSRGFALLDVDYRGSTGYGTRYRNLLKGKWGVYDLDDVVAGAEQLIKDDVVDPKNIFIAGPSAGGYTTISAVTFTNFFTAGASLYGISDLRGLSNDTHKFESRYLEGLVGAVSGPLYEDRSGFFHSDKVATPIIFFQGSEDKIVPVDQAENMYNVVKKNGIPTAFVLYQGEYHGFVKEANRKHALEAEIFFFSRIGNFTLADVTSNITIDNLDNWRGKTTPTTESSLTTSLL